MRPESPAVCAWNKTAKAAARNILEVGGLVNELGNRLNGFVHSETAQLLAAGKLVGLVGGDHSIPYGALKAAAEKHASFGILHFDAHCDMRAAYEGFTWSHASIMHNVLTGIPAVAKLVQVGIRDFCEEEQTHALSQGSRVNIFYDGDLARRRFSGEPWDKVCQDIVQELPEKVWVSFDIDGLDPRYCPHTGTPVPGGLDFREANHLLGSVTRSGRRIIGFDLNEVAPDPSGQSEWDANVGARLLYKLSAWTLASQGLAKLH
jgi:agmatinase